MTEISVERAEGLEPATFTVTLRDAEGESRHTVTVSASERARLAPSDTAPEDLVAAAFRFLLDREPRGAILGRFDITVIAHYFPDFEQDLPRYLARDDAG